MIMGERSINLAHCLGFSISEATMPTVEHLSERCPLVIIDYNDLAAERDLTAHIKEAFSHDGLGALAVKNVPTFAEKRQAILPLAWRFGQLPAEVKAKYEVPPFFQRGWDCGHEAMKDGVPDFSKGSFYINPVVDTFPNVDPELIKKYPTFFGDNIFPAEQIPAFEEAIKAASKLMMDVGALVAAQCDAYVHGQVPAFAKDKCQTIVRGSKHHACRLLHYFAFADATSIPQDLDSWCGWHNDHCTLTSLMPAMYHDKDGTPIPCPDKEAGLYIKSRNGDLVHVAYVRGVPGDYLLFQIGETAQVHSGGYLKATPHMVRGCTTPGVSRSTMAVFLEPGHAETMAMPDSSKCDLVNATASPHLPPTVPELGSRWKNETGDTFGEFSRRTFEAYYNIKSA